MTYIVIVTLCVAAGWYAGHEFAKTKALLDEIAQRIEDSQYEVYYRTKDGHYWVFRFTDRERLNTIRQVGLYALDPDIDFSWHDAEIVTQQIRSVGVAEIRVTV